MIGIYKITSPSGKVYIGQSIDIAKAWNIRYSYLACKKQPKIYNSLKKYGFDNHQREIICECKVEDLDKLETYYKQIELDKVGGDWSKVLFCQLIDGKGGPKSEETKRKISENNIGKLKHSKKQIEKWKLERKGKKVPYTPRPNKKGVYSLKNKTKEEMDIIIQKRISKTKGVSKNKGLIITKEHREKTRQKLLNRVYSSETILKMKNTKRSKLPKINQLFNDGSIKEWNCILDASETLKINPRSIKRAINSKREYAGYKWEYKR